MSFVAISAEHKDLFPAYVTTCVVELQYYVRYVCHSYSVFGISVYWGNMFFLFIKIRTV